MISVPEIFIFSMYFLNPLGLAMEGEFPVLGAGEHEQLPCCSQDAAMELHSSSWFRMLPNAGDPQSPLWYSACPDISPRTRCGAPQSSHGRHVANSCAGECAPVQPSRMASEEPACTSARACACACVCAAYPVPNPLGPTEREAAQEDYTKQSHFVQPPSPSRALFSPSPSHQDCQSTRASCTRGVLEQQGRCPQHDLAAPNTVLRRPGTVCVPLYVHTAPRHS